MRAGPYLRVSYLAADAEYHACAKVQTSFPGVPCMVKRFFKKRGREEEHVQEDLVNL